MAEIFGRKASIWRLLLLLGFLGAVVAQNTAVLGPVPTEKFRLTAPGDYAKAGNCAYWWRLCEGDYNIAQCDLACDACTDIAPEISSCCSSHATDKLPMSSLAHCLPFPTTSVTTIGEHIGGDAFGCEFMQQRYTGCEILTSSFDALPLSAQQGCVCSKWFNGSSLDDIPALVSECINYLTTAAPGLVPGYRTALEGVCNGANQIITTSGGGAVLNTGSPTLQLVPVSVVQPTGPITAEPHVNQPNWRGSGPLLAGACGVPEFTLVNAGNSVLFAPFVGCVNDKPECCPWSQGVQNPITLKTLTSGLFAQTTAPPASGEALVGAAGAYPSPAFSSGQPPAQAALGKCPDDYGSVAGGCCPSGFALFNGAVGNSTPCYSSLNHVTQAPVLTAGVAGQPTDTTKSTSAAVNVVLAIYYPVESSGGLSAGASAGIGIGAGLAAIAIVGIAILLYLRHRKKKRAQAAAAAPGSEVAPVPTEGYTKPELAST